MGFIVKSQFVIMGKIKCLQCGTILESKSVHDFQACTCPNEAFVDGGNDYLRYGCKNPDKIKIIEDGRKNTSAS